MPPQTGVPGVPGVRKIKQASEQASTPHCASHNFLVSRRPPDAERPTAYHHKGAAAWEENSPWDALASTNSPSIKATINKPGLLEPFSKQASKQASKKNPTHCRTSLAHKWSCHRKQEFLGSEKSSKQASKQANHKTHKQSTFTCPHCLQQYQNRATSKSRHSTK